MSSSKKIKLQKIKLKGKWYAKDKNSDHIYDLEMANLGILVDADVKLSRIIQDEDYIGPLGLGRIFLHERPHSKNKSKRNYEAISKHIMPELKKLYKKKQNEFIESEYKPGGPGYKLAEKRFNSNKKKLGKKIRSLSLPKKYTFKELRKVKSI